MILIKEPSSLRNYLKQSSKTVGFVPTMGALHEGHLQLVATAKSQADLVVCSIFVNPTQFNDPADFAKYPITLAQDILALERVGLDILFLPTVEGMYPNGTTALETYDLGFLETVFEGAFRPGHFQGVCQVMSRLLKAVKPQLLFMGQKDYQQCMVVRKLIELIKIDTSLVTCPTIRETDGLAMSSRNKRLTNEQRENATGIFKALNWMQKNLSGYSISELTSHAKQLLEQHDFKTDYVAIADANSLEPIASAAPNKELVALVAAFQGDVRLIDNMLLHG
ncbi:MAG: pantoate--beta-alanine ligase [Chitinophagaceae bacterium]|nr:pantoate--beta-alanine ligase [Chitinophagaceae bacterium]